MNLEEDTEGAGRASSPLLPSVDMKIGLLTPIYTVTANNQAE